MFNRSETAPDYQDSNASWRGPRCPCHLRTGPGYLSRCHHTTRTHVSKTVSCCFAALRQMRSIRSCIPQQAMLSLVVLLVLSRLAYGIFGLNTFLLVKQVNSGRMSSPVLPFKTLVGLVLLEQNRFRQDF